MNANHRPLNYLHTNVSIPSLHVYKLIETYKMCVEGWPFDQLSPFMKEILCYAVMEVLCILNMGVINDVEHAETC